MMHFIVAETGNLNELSLLAAQIECLAKGAPVYHKQFAVNYLPALEMAVRDKILGASSAQLRNIKKERVEEILEFLYKVLLPRIGSRDAVSLNSDKI